MEADFKDAKADAPWNELWVLMALDMNDIGSWDFDVGDGLAKRTLAHDRIFGYPTMLDRWTYDMFMDHVLPEDRTRIDDLLKISIAEQTEWRVECRIRRADDEIRWILAVGRPICDSKGAVRRFIGTVKDITDRKLTEKQLFEAQKLEAVGQLTSGVSHYFNNLLAVIMGNIDLLRGTPGMPPEAERLIATSLRAAKRGADLTRQLVAFAQKMALSPRMVDLGAELQHIASVVRRTLPASVQLQVLVDPQPIPAMVDTGQLSNAITNLTNNACESMKTGGVLLISVGIEDRDATDTAPARRYGVITVQDTGCGMPPDVLAKAFEPFFTTRKVGQGTGLGLSMVYGFMEQSQGHAELSSTEGEGTTVKLLFPLAVGRLEEVTPT